MELLDIEYEDFDTYFSSANEQLSQGTIHLDDAEQWLIVTWCNQTDNLMELFSTSPQLLVDAQLLVEKIKKLHNL